jgi:mRNA-degrading endonuclease RelE of RelBE toxin-antitoxin system
VKSHITDRFRKLIERLPQEIRQQAREAYRLFKQDPYHPQLHFKQVHQKKPVYSARIAYRYRAVGIVKGDVIVWFWIGSHDDYDKLLKRL